MKILLFSISLLFGSNYAVFAQDPVEITAENSENQEEIVPNSQEEIVPETWAEFYSRRKEQAVNHASYVKEQVVNNASYVKEQAVNRARDAYNEAMTYVKEHPDEVMLVAVSAVLILTSEIISFEKELSNVRMAYQGQVEVLNDRIAERDTSILKLINNLDKALLEIQDKNIEISKYKESEELIQKFSSSFR